jgi:universal stress protein G
MYFTTIIVAIDVNDPENAQAAIARAVAVAGTEARIHFLYVRYFLPSRYTELLASDFDLREEEEALTAMRQWCTSAGVDEARTRFITRRGRVRDEVIAEAAEQNADLIVIGSDQPSLSSRLLGSNASAIVHQSPVSVLVARR